MRVQQLCKFIAAGAIAVGSSTAFADWSDDFNGGYDQTWSFTGLFSAPADSTAGDFLSLTAPAGHFAGGGTVAELFTDVRVQATLNPDQTAKDDVMGVAARTTGLGTGYAAVINFTTGTLELYNTSQTGGTSGFFGADAIDSFASTNDYVIILDAVGSGAGLSLVANVYDPSDLGTSLAQVLANNTLFPGNLGTDFASGNSGVGEFPEPAGAAVFATFDDVSSTTIPEPSAIALLGLGGLAMARRRTA